ncbi:uncharacterized protein abca12 isoform X2 [Labrus mixtus]|uniref:uncharacterized protein abca12 isoform X2 n=1 Tax=Labrus mixtus TaxID=508554 RepID=UPI0029BFFE8C|nr:uncharacterized protein abca12 isoform X2 [Labrus mixtus]
MAFLHQLRLLLWKNGLAVIRQPLWSLTLITWPLVIFIIIAITRHQFPPIVKQTCFVGPRNLPSTGFFPFLETLMCNTDSNCHNTSRLVDPAASKSSQKSTWSKSFPPAHLMNKGEFFNFDSTFDPKGATAAVVEVLSNIVGSSRKGREKKATFMNINETLLDHNETLHTMLESANMLKRAMCAVTLPMINVASSPLSFAVVTFCKSNETVFEVSLNTLNQILMDLMLSKPDEMATYAGMAVVLFDQLQNQTSLWESLLVLPQLFSSGSIDQALHSTETLLANIQGAMHAIQSKYPEADAPLSVVKLMLVVGLKTIHYAQNWPGKEVSIHLGEIVKLQNDSLSEMVKQVLQEVEIPLDKAIALTMDSDMLHEHVCNNSANSLWLKAACSTGTVHMLLGWIDSDKAAKQVLLAWSKHVAPRDIHFAKWLLQSLMEGSIQGEPHSSQTPRTRRSIETQPQNIEEELFLEVGEVILEIIQLVPEVDMLVHSMLRSGFQSMKIATLTLEIVDEIMSSVLKDADQLQQTYLTLLTNQSEASLWLGHVVDSVKEAIMKITASEPPTCEDVFGTFEWLFNTESVTVEVWRSMICESGSNLEQVLLLGLMPLVESAQDFNSTLMGNADYNVTLPMILSEWQKLNNNSMQFGMFVDRSTEELGGAYWANWMPDNSTHDVTWSLQQSVFLVLVNVGGHIEKSQLWHQAKDYFYMVNWVLNYRPDHQVTTQPPNCSVDISSSTINCNTETGFNWPQFVTSMTQTLMSPNQDILVNFLKGTVNLLQHVYSDILKSVVGSFLKENIQTGDALSDFLINMVHNLQNFVKKITMLPDENIADSDIMDPLVSNLLQSTGLTHLLPLLYNDGPINVSTVLGVATKLIRQNQKIFTFNETDPTMHQLERLIMQFLSIEGNLTMSLSNLIGHKVVTYAGYFHPDDVAHFIEAIRPFINQTSPGIVETILRAMELLKTVTESPNGDPTNSILGYIRQLQDFIISLFRLRRVQHSLLPNGELSAAQVTDLYLISKDFVKLLTPEGLQGLIDAGPDGAQDIIAQKLIAFLPAEVHQDADLFFQDFKALQCHLAKCTAGHDCLNGISEIFKFLNQTLDMVLLANGDVNIQIALPNLFPIDQEYEEIVSIMFPLLLSSNDAAYIETFNQALYFITLVMATPNITISDVQNALQQSNLTLEELNNMVSLFGAANINDLMSKVLDVINSQKCFEPQDNQMVTAQCVMGFVNSVSGFLTHLPVLQNETAVLSLIPLIVNNTIRDVIHFDFSSDPNKAVLHTLNTTLANIKMGLQLNHLNTPEIMKEITVLEDLIKLAANQEPFTNIFNSTLTDNPMHAQKVYLEIVDWYLQRLENITRHSSLSELLHPIFYLTQMQVTLQLAQTDFTLFVSNQIEHLMDIIQHPIDGAGVVKIGQTVVDMFHRLFKLIKANLEFQNNLPGMEPFFDTTVLHAAELHIKQYLDITQKWIEQPNFPFVLTSMLLSQNSSISPLKCFEPQQNQIVTAQCVNGLINGVSSFLSNLPVLQNETAFLSLLPIIVNNTIQDVIHVDFSSNPDTAVIHVLNTTLANIKMGLQVNHLNTPEIMKEITVLEDLIKLAGNQEPLNNIFNSTLTENPMYAQKVYLEMLDWYLKRVENITRHSSLSELLHPILYVTQRQVTLQLAQTDFTLFVSNQIEHLMDIIQHPIDGAGVVKIGQTAVDMFHRLFKLIKANLEFQNNLPGMEPFFNTTVLHAAELEIKQYLDITQKWMNQPDVPLILTSMLQWGNPNITASITLTDLHHLLQTMAHFLNTEQLGYLSIISNITESLKNALLVAEQPGGIQSDYFIAAILEVVQSSMQILSATTNGPLPYIEQNILEIVKHSLKLIVQPDMNFDSSRLVSIQILKNVENVIETILPEISEYLLPGIKVATTYFESSLMASGPDGWNHIILNELITVQSLLPPNSTAQAYVSTLINITHFFLESGQGNMSLWAMFENASAENVPMIIGKMGKFLGMLWSIIMGGPASHVTVSSLEGFAKLAPILEQMITGMADQVTWDKLENTEQLGYLSIISKITESLKNALLVAEQPGGIQSDYFIAAILEAVQSSMQILSATTNGTLLYIEQNILEIVNNSLKLIVQPDMNFDSSRLVSIQILKNVENVIETILPEISEYLLPGIKVATTYFESSLMASGPDGWNHIILNELITVQSLLPPNSTAQAYVSTLINITHFFLESGQGNMSLWAMFENASAENVPMIIGKGFAKLAPILEQVITGKADQVTWDKLENILEALLSLLEGTELWESVSSVVPLFEKIVGSLVNNLHAENVMRLSLQKPMVTLMKEIAQSVNSSHFNLTEVTERMQVAIEHTVQAAQQANSTLECSDVLKAWDPVREAAGLSHATMAMWCNLNLRPVLEAYMEAQVVYGNLNMSHMNMGPMTVDTTAERIVETLQSVYQVSLNRTHVAQTLIMTFSSHLSMLTGQPLSPEAQLHWQKQLQDLQLLNSLSSLKMLTDQLLMVAPSLQPFIEALEKALHHILDNYHQIQDSSSSEDIFKEAVMIFLNNSNITSEDISSMMLGNLSDIDVASLTDMMRQAVKFLMKMFEDVPVVYQGLEHFLASNDTDLLVQKVAEMVAWLASTEEYGLDMLTEALAEIFHILRPLLSALTNMIMDMPAHMGLFEDLADNIVAMVRQIVMTGGLLGPKNFHHGKFQQDMTGLNHTNGVRRKRDAQWMPVRSPMDDFIDLFYIDYHTMFKALSVLPTTEDIMETVHVFFANPDLGVVIKGVTSDMSWNLNVSQENTIDATMGMLSFFTLPGMFETSSMELLQNSADMIPDHFLFATMLQKISKALASESPENLLLMENTFKIASELLQIDLTDSRFIEKLDNLTAQVCSVEKTETVRMLMSTLAIEPGQLCYTLMPALQIVAKSLMMNSTSLSEALFEAVIGDPSTYDVNFNWTSVMSEGLNFNTSSLNSLNINIKRLEEATVGEMMRNEAAFVEDVQQYMDFDPAALQLLMNTTLPNNYLMILSWLVNLRHCNSKSFATLDEADVKLLEMFCSMPVDQWYSFSLLIARHVNMEKLIYRMVLSDEMQGLVGVMLQMAEIVMSMMDKILPAVGQLENYLRSMEDLKLKENEEFHEMTRGLRSSHSTKATFVTLSRALCSNGILALFGLSQLQLTSDLSNPSSQEDQKREEMIERFKLPRNASPFCMSMYLDMVNTTGGAIAWAFLKPMLMGQILFTPDTPVTRDIMEKSNATLQELADLRKYSGEWIESSKYIIKSAQLLSHTLPMLQNSLGNSFVKNFIEMQTDINVGKMKETLSNFSNMTLMLEKNKHMLKQITTLSTLMVNLSSCVKFDRYRGYNSVEELNADGQELAKNRELYASVIFKLPKDSNSSRKRREASFTSSLPPKVSYTIRMHMDNVMRTDRVRNPYFTKQTHISARQTLRYNRGFVYLQENIDRAIIATQTGQTVAEPAVQLQPFPYPCHLRDEYLEAISFVFPLMLMIAWLLFVADFVKKLVHERELRLHEYMKMMGVNPLSHFFAWFLECATYLVLTIFILTLVLKHGNILPNSDGFLLFLYLCDYGLSIMAFSYLVSSFFDKTFIAGLSGSLLYILCFFPFIVVRAVETTLTLTQKSILSLFSPTCFSYASQYISRYESQGQGIHWSNSYSSPIAGDTASFGWLCWLMLIDSLLYFIIGAYIRTVFPGKYGIPAPWYFPFKASFWAELCGCVKSNNKARRGLLFTNIMQEKQPVFSDDKGKGQSTLYSQAAEDHSDLPVGVALHGLSKMYGDRVAIQDLNVSFYEGHVTTLLGHNGAGKTTTMSLLTGLFAPTSGTIEIYGRDMQNNIDDVRRELGVCMQYDVLFDHMTTKEHLLLYGQIKAPHWSKGELHEQVRTILEETGMYAHRHKRVGTLSGGMKRKLSISIAFIGGSRLVVLDEPTTGVDPCSRRSIWDIVIQHKKQRTIIMSTHHLDEAEVLSDRITFLERGGLKCVGSPFHLKDKLGQGYKLTLTKKMQNLESEQIDNVELKSFIQAHVPEARLKEAQGGDLVYSLPAFNSSNASSYRSLLTALDANLDTLQLGGYGISDTTLEEVFLQLGHENTELGDEDCLPTISETVSDTASMDSFTSDLGGSTSSFSDNIKLTGSTMARGMTLACQQMAAMLTKRFHHSRRDWKGLICQILLPVLFMVAAMGLGSIKSDLQHYPELELSPALYKFRPSYSFFSNSDPNSEQLISTMMSFPGIDNACLNKPNNPVCSRSTDPWRSSGNSSKAFSGCKCTRQEQICDSESYQPPHKRTPSSQIVYNLSGINVEEYLVTTANDFIRNRYGGFALGMPLPADLQMDVKSVPKNRTLSKVWFNPEGHHTMPAYLNSINNFILRSNLPADKDPRKYAISVSSHPYFGRVDDEDAIVQGMLQILVAMCVLTGYSITTASFAIYVVNEHHSGSKRLQHIAGISEPFYWAVNFFFDMVVYLIPVTLTVAVIAAFQIPAFTDRQNLAAITLLLVLFGFATFPWMYLLSGVFKDAEMAFITFVCINLFISVNTVLSTSILFFLSQISTIKAEVVLAIFNRLCNAFLIFPQFNFGHGMMQLARKNIEVQILSGYGIDAYQNPFSMDSMAWLFISSFIQGVVLFSLRLLLNRFIIRKVRHLICSRKTVSHVAPEDEDQDVTTEHLRVASGAAGSDILQVNHLTKVYQNFSTKVQAVKGVSVGIPAGECFGLLGENGAGKTTTFKMLTGDVSPTDGTAQIRDRDGRLVDIMDCRHQGINIGYCPQVDALDNLLTGEEHLYFYARIRGISKREIDGVVRYLLKRLELNYHRNITTEGYSCGTRRKLSTALALIGHPQILLLDEPSSGMDPRTKRHLWKIISEEVKGKCAVVLTSHSMEECEALCGRLAIMVKGQFRCLGSLQHIKNRFGSGFTVKMYLAEASCNAEAITGFMQRRFPSTYLKDQHSNMAEYHVPVAPGGVADIFDQLESNKNALQIKHFSVSQTTLDEVFINFALEKSDMESIPINDEGDSDRDSLGSIKAVES